MASNRSERVRNRYGICLNDSCSKCKGKEVQEIPARKDFVCADSRIAKLCRGGNKLVGIGCVRYKLDLHLFSPFCFLDSLYFFASALSLPKSL